MHIPEERVKLTVYADDLTLLLADNRSFDSAMTHLEDFQSFFGLKVNQNKTEVITIGEEAPPDDMNATQTITITEITHTTRRHARIAEEKNYGRIIGRMLSTLNLWKTMGLTLLGRAHAVKAQVLSLL